MCLLLELEPLVESVLWDTQEMEPNVLVRKSVHGMANGRSPCMRLTDLTNEFIAWSFSLQTLTNALPANTIALRAVPTLMVALCVPVFQALNWKIAPIVWVCAIVSPVCDVTSYIHFKNYYTEDMK